MTPDGLVCLLLIVIGLAILNLVLWLKIPRANQDRASKDDYL